MAFGLNLGIPEVLPMKSQGIQKSILSVVLLLNWSLPAQARVLPEIIVEEELTPPRIISISDKPAPLNLNLPGARRIDLNRRQELDRSMDYINSGLSPSAQAEINAINNKAPLMSVPLEFDQSDLILGGLAMTAMLAITVTNSEVRLLKSVQDQKSPGMDRTMNFGKRFGEDYGRIAIAGSIVWALVTDEDKKISQILPVELQAIVAVGLANNLMKIMFKRALPTESPNDPYKTSTSNRPPDLGFPSGHTSVAIVAATIAAHNMENLGPLIPAILYTAAVITGVSRMYHNQHWATDVIASVYSYYLTKAILNQDKNKGSKYNLVIMPLIDVRTRTFGMYAQMITDPVESRPCGQKYSGLKRVEACVIEATRK